MLTSAPLIPHKLTKKLEAAVKRFQREYDHLTLADARRLLTRHDYRVPVLGSLHFFDNGALKEISLSENLKRREPSERRIAVDLTIFGYPAQGARELWSPFIRWIVADQVTKNRKAGWYQTDKLSDDELDGLLRHLPDYERHSINIHDASLLALRMMTEIERNVRKDESNHQKFDRHARPVPPELIRQMRAEKEQAQRWFDEETAQGYPPSMGYRADFLAEEDRIVLAYRDYHDPN